MSALNFFSGVAQLIEQTLAHPFAQVLADYLHTMPKTYWLVREPVARQQWTFLLGTNWKGLKDWRTQGLYRAETPMA